eukprot:1161212-Pelagomonas_calceolata.AAC.6
MRVHLHVCSRQKQAGGCTCGVDTHVDMHAACQNKHGHATNNAHTPMANTFHQCLAGVLSQSAIVPCPRQRTVMPSTGQSFA